MLALSNACENTWPGSFMAYVLLGLVVSLVLFLYVHSVWLFYFNSLPKWVFCRALSLVFFFWFWRYLTRRLIWHLSPSSIRPSIILVRLWNHARIRSCNQPVLINKVKFHIQGNHGGLWWGSNTRPPLRVRRATHSFTPLTIMLHMHSGAIWNDI